MENSRLHVFWYKKGCFLSDRVCLGKCGWCSIVDLDIVLNVQPCLFLPQLSSAGAASQKLFTWMYSNSVTWKETLRSRCRGGIKCLNMVLTACSSIWAVSVVIEMFPWLLLTQSDDFESTLTLWAVGWRFLFAEQVWFLPSWGRSFLTVALDRLFSAVLTLLLHPF